MIIFGIVFSINLTNFIMSLPVILAIILGTIEVVARVVPTVKMWAPLGIIIKILEAVSEFLNAKK